MSKEPLRILKKAPGVASSQAQNSSSPDFIDLSVKFKNRSRPFVVEEIFQKKNFSFMMLDVDSYTARFLPDLVSGSEPQGDIYRVYGVTNEGYSVTLHVHGFRPVVHVACPLEVREGTEEQIRCYLNSQFRDLPVRDVALVPGRSLYGYAPDQGQRMIQLTMASTRDAQNLASRVQKGLLHGLWEVLSLMKATVPPGEIDRVYEGNLDGFARFMADAGIRGCGWLSIPTARLLRRANQSALVRASPLEKASSSQIELDAHVDSIIGHAPAGEWGHIAPMRVLSFDIECMAPGGGFPNPHKESDKVIQIASIVHVVGGDAAHCAEVREAAVSTTIYRSLLTLKTCSPIAGVDLEECKNEARLLDSFRRLVCATDPDIITGWNVENFDLWYLNERSHFIQGKEPMVRPDDVAKLRKKKETAPKPARPTNSFFDSPPGSPGGTRKKPSAPAPHPAPERPRVSKFSEYDKSLAYKFNTFSRISGFHCVTAPHLFQSKQLGDRESYTTPVPGRIVLDLMQVVQQSFKLRSYTLNNVSLLFLGAQKEDVHHSLITPLFLESDDTRRRLGVYCLKDAHLPLQLMDTLMTCFNFVEMARVMRVPMRYIHTRGQGVKVLSQLYAFAKPLQLHIPMLPRAPQGKSFVGATVFKPKKGYYTREQPVTTLDFTSLYPSIMRAHNIGYSTWVNVAGPSTAEALARLGLLEDDVFTSPLGDMFVKPSVQKGILPEILSSLLRQRSIAKKDLAAATGSVEKAVLNARQLALKVAANSVYGFTGSLVGKLPCVPVSSSVTAIGRGMIEKTKRLVEEKYSRINGFPHNSEVIYGDTDSVMIRFGVKTIEESIRLGLEAAKYVTSQFPDPISLEFEKVYAPYLLLKRKRYAGLLWTRPEKYDKLDVKGMEAIRRDNCKLASQLFNRCLNKMLVESDVPGALALIKNTISNLLRGEIDMSLLVISKNLTKQPHEYKAKQPHATLTLKLRKRNPQTAPNIGDRVPFIIAQGDPRAKLHEKAEDPLHALKNNISIDTNYYLDNQLKPPLIRMLKRVITREKAMKLFTGEHTLHVKRIDSLDQQRAQGKGSLGSFISVEVTCPICKIALTPSEKRRGICRRCVRKGLVPEFCMQTAYRLQKAEHRFARLRVECQRCAASATSEILCSSNDCPIYYARVKALADVEDGLRAMEKFADWK